MVIRLNKRNFLTALTVFYFLATPITSAFTVILGTRGANIAVNACLALLMFLCILRGGVQRLKMPLLVYVLVSAVILTSYLAHPEYIEWFTHNYYGIVPAFLNLRSGIWALMIFSLYEDKEDMLRDLKIVSILVFLAYFGKFVVAMRRGYWIISAADGTSRHANYDMEFGYRILFPASFFAASGVLRGNRRHFLFFLFCVLIILVGGSRGPAVWSVFVLILLVPYKYKSMSPRKKRAVVAACVVVIPLLLLILFRLDDVLAFGLSVAKALGIKSRTILALLEGSFAKDHGRNVIYDIAADLIKTGGPFGRGFYGDRYYIGQRFRWGYAHNLFLELMVEFGYLGGGLISLLLVVGVIRCYRKCRDTTSQIIFVTLLVGSMRLMVSNSFWYEARYWALIALLLQMNRRDNVLRPEKKLLSPKGGGHSPVENL